MKHEISLRTLVMAKRALDDLSEWQLEQAVKDIKEFDRTADMRKYAYKASGEIEMAINALLLLTKLEVTDASGND